MLWGLVLLGVVRAAGFAGAAEDAAGAAWCCSALSRDPTLLLTSSSELSASSLMGSSLLLGYEGNSTASLENTNLGILNVGDHGIPICKHQNCT